MKTHQQAKECDPTPDRPLHHRAHGIPSIRSLHVEPFPNSRLIVAMRSFPISAAVHKFPLEYKPFAAEDAEVLEPVLRKRQS
jgi:hypothetical protein